MTTVDEIQEWFDIANEMDCSHMIVATDEFSWEDYPVFVTDGDVQRRLDGLANQPMTRVMEVYKIELGWEAQASGRVMNL